MSYVSQWQCYKSSLWIFVLSLSFGGVVLSLSNRCRVPIYKLFSWAFSLYVAYAPVVECRFIVVVAAVIPSSSLTLPFLTHYFSLTHPIPAASLSLSVALCVSLGFVFVLVSKCYRKCFDFAINFLFVTIRVRFLWLEIVFERNKFYVYRSIAFKCRYDSTRFSSHAFKHLFRLINPSLSLCNFQRVNIFNIALWQLIAFFLFIAHTTFWIHSRFCDIFTII